MEPLIKCSIDNFKNMVLVERLKHLNYPSNSIQIISENKDYFNTNSI